MRPLPCLFGIHSWTTDEKRGCPYIRCDREGCEATDVYPLL